jgi:hypothetical protein
MARPRKTYTPFALWVLKFGIHDLAEILRITPTNVRLWVRGTGIPRPALAAEILRIANGELTWSDIYGHL